MKRKVKDHTGEIFGKLKVIEYAGTRKDRQATWRCQCECGNVVVVLGKNLRSGATQSCGCSFNARRSTLFTPDMDAILQEYYIKAGAKAVKQAIRALIGISVTVDQIYSRARHIGVRHTSATIHVKDKAKAKPKIGRPRGAVVDMMENPLWLASGGPLVPLLCSPWREGVKLVLSPEEALYANRQAVRRTREYYRKNSRQADKPIWKRMRMKDELSRLVSTDPQSISLEIPADSAQDSPQIPLTRQQGSENAPTRRQGRIAMAPIGQH